MTNTDISVDTLQAIWDAHNLGQILSITQPSGGMVNRVARASSRSLWTTTT